MGDDRVATPRLSSPIYRQGTRRARRAEPRRHRPGDAPGTARRETRRRGGVPPRRLQVREEDCEEAAGATRIKRLRDTLGNQMISELLVKNIARRGYMLAIDKDVIRVI